MAFGIAMLPEPVLKIYKLGVGAWPLALETAIWTCGLRDVDLLTNMVFFLHHPERMVGLWGEPIKPGETDLAEEWKYLRRLVKKRVDAQPPSTIVYPPPFVPNEPVPMDDQMGTPGHLSS